jgi:hypothetical protein
MSIENSEKLNPDEMRIYGYQADNEEDCREWLETDPEMRTAKEDSSIKLDDEGFPVLIHRGLE